MKHLPKSLGILIRVLCIGVCMLTIYPANGNFSLSKSASPVINESDAIAVIQVISSERVNNSQYRQVANVKVLNVVKGLIKEQEEIKVLFDRKDYDPLDSHAYSNYKLKLKSKYLLFLNKEKHFYKIRRDGYFLVFNDYFHDMKLEERRSRISTLDEVVAWTKWKIYQKNMPDSTFQNQQMKSINEKLMENNEAKKVAKQWVLAFMIGDLTSIMKLSKIPFRDNCINISHELETPSKQPSVFYTTKDSLRKFFGMKMKAFKKIGCKTIGEPSIQDTEQNFHDSFYWYFKVTPEISEGPRLSIIVRIERSIEGFKVNSFSIYSISPRVYKLMNQYTDIARMMRVEKENGENWVIDKIKEMIRNGHDVNEIGIGGQYPLFSAVQNDNKAIVEFLIKAGANVNQRIAGKTALVQAIKNGKVEILGFLLSHGLLLDFNEQEKKTLLSGAISEEIKDLLNFFFDKKWNTNNINREFIYRVSNGHLGFATFLVNSGANVNVRSLNGLSPLLLAVKSNHHELVKLLLTHGADFNTRTKTGRGVLDLAKDSKMVRILWEYKTGKAP